MADFSRFPNSLLFSLRLIPPIFPLAIRLTDFFPKVEFVEILRGGAPIFRAV